MWSHLAWHVQRSAAICRGSDPAALSPTASIIGNHRTGDLGGATPPSYCSPSFDLDCGVIVFWRAASTGPSTRVRSSALGRQDRFFEPSILFAGAPTSFVPPLSSRSSPQLPRQAPPIGPSKG